MNGPYKSTALVAVVIFVVLSGFSLSAMQVPEDKPSREDQPEKAPAQSGSSAGTQAAPAPAAQHSLAKQSQNPIASLISVPLQNNMSFGVGDTDRIQNVFNIQPVLPFPLGDKVNFIARTIIPVIRQPILTDDSQSGLGDINFSGFFSPAKPGRLIWGAGPALSLRTATDDTLGTGRWAAGPTFVALTMPGPWVVGALVSNVWSFAGDSSRAEVNQFTLQYFVNYNLSNGWYVSSAPILSSNWEADPGEQWVVPFGGGVGRVFRVGKQPLNATVQAYWNAVHPEQGSNWSLRLQLTFLFPK